MNQTEAIRQAFEELGTDASVDRILAWLKSQSVKVTTSVESIISRERKKATEEHANTNILHALGLLRELLDMKEPIGDNMPELIQKFKIVHGLAGGWDNLEMILGTMQPTAAPTAPAPSKDRKKA